MQHGSNTDNDRHGADRDITAVTRQGTGENDGKETFGREHHKSGNAKRKAGEEDRSQIFRCFFRIRTVAFFPHRKDSIQTALTA